MNENIENISKFIKSNTNDLNDVLIKFNIKTEYSLVSYTYMNDKNVIIFYNKIKDIYRQLSIYFLYKSNIISDINEFKLLEKEILDIDYLQTCLMINDELLINEFDKYYGKRVYSIYNISKKLNIPSSYIKYRLEILNLIKEKENKQIN